MKLVIDQESTTAISEQIYFQIRRRIISGDMESANRLPSVRQLATDLKVAPNTIAKTYYRLSDEGFVELSGRKGTFVSDSWKKRKRGKPELERLNALGMDYILAAIEMEWDFNTLISHMVKLSENISRKKSVI